MNGNQMKDVSNISIRLSQINTTSPTPRDVNKAHQLYDEIEQKIRSAAKTEVSTALISNMVDFRDEHINLLLDKDITLEKFVSRLKLMATTSLTVAGFDEIIEGTSGAPIAPQSAQRSEDRQRLEYLYKYLLNLVPSPYQVIFNQDHLLVKDASKDVYASKTVYEGVDTNKLTQYIGSILEYMIDQKMNITPLPEVKIKRDAENAANFFGRTAYYDPNNREVVLYVEGRHPKDICRSFVHEMIHHIQNIEGRLGNIQTSNTNEDDHLMEIEKEAYLRGNITFRNWEDSIKNAEVYKYEGTKYDLQEKLSSHLHSKVLEIKLDPKNAVDVNSAQDKGSFTVGDIEYKYSVKQVESPYGDNKVIHTIGFAPTDTTDSLPTGDVDGKTYIKILSTMYKIILDYAQQNNPDYIGISSLDNSKNYHKIYNGLVSINSIPGYFVKTKKLDFTANKSQSGRFIILKKRSDQK